MTSNSAATGDDPSGEEDPGEGQERLPDGAGGEPGARDTVDGAEPQEAAADDPLAGRLEAAQATVRRYVYSAMAVGLVPAPVADLAGLMALQLKMVHALANEYEVGFREDLGKSSIAALAGSLGPVTLARGIFGSLVKAIPIVGTAIGLAAQPVLAAAFTHAVGKVFIQHFESGGTLFDLDPAKMRDRFAQRFRDGKRVAVEISAERRGQ